METPALSQLMGAYLHQDYLYEGTVEDNVTLFMEEDSQLASQLPAEVDRLLASGVSEADIDRLVHELGCQVLPPDNTSYRDWLAQIADHVRAATAAG